MYGNLTKVLHTDFTGGNKVLTELSKFYNSCIAVQLSTILEYVEQLVPRIRAVYEDFGKCFVQLWYRYSYYNGVYMIFIAMEEIELSF